MRLSSDTWLNKQDTNDLPYIYPETFEGTQRRHKSPALSPVAMSCVPLDIIPKPDSSDPSCSPGIAVPHSTPDEPIQSVSSEPSAHNSLSVRSSHVVDPAGDPPCAFQSSDTSSCPFPVSRDPKTINDAQQMRSVIPDVLAEGPYRKRARSRSHSPVDSQSKLTRRD